MSSKGVVWYQFSGWQWVHHRTAPIAACLAITLSSLPSSLRTLHLLLPDRSLPAPCCPSDLQLWLWWYEYLIWMILSKIAHILHKWSSERWNRCLSTLLSTCHLGWNSATTREKGHTTYLERKWLLLSFSPLLEETTRQWKRQRAASPKLSWWPHTPEEAQNTPW